ncbi:MAG: 5'/3'-nucleotidase SurE [Burkholderiaceae bacterium]|nr:5'/3'-nucleotidase SurE [Burkholderiaceae bacterium]
MRILISNDDGYFSPGIEKLAEVASAFGEVTVIAPERDRSGASNSLTLDRPLSVRVAHNGFLYVNGTPTDCVHIAVTGLLEHKPDIVLSGINDGANMGDDTIYSGTVAAAMEGYLLGVPSIAFSLARRGGEHLDTAAEVARRILARHARRRLPTPILLNVNVPARPLSELRGVMATRLGRRHLAEPVVRATSPRGDTIYWIGPAGRAKEAGPGTDFNAVDSGWASVTPLDIDLTAPRALRVVREWIDEIDE